MKPTLIEIVIILIIAFILIINMFGLSSENVSIGANGIVETRCVGGYKFVVGQNARPVQLLDNDGRGIPCGDR